MAGRPDVGRLDGATQSDRSLASMVLQSNSHGWELALHRGRKQGTGRPPSDHGYLYFRSSQLSLPYASGGGVCTLSSVPTCWVSRLLAGTLRAVAGRWATRGGERFRRSGRIRAWLLSGEIQAHERDCVNRTGSGGDAATPGQEGRSRHHRGGKGQTTGKHERRKEQEREKGDLTPANATLRKKTVHFTWAKLDRRRV